MLILTTIVFIFLNISIFEYNTILSELLSFQKFITLLLMSINKNLIQFYLKKYKNTKGFIQCKM